MSSLNTIISIALLIIVLSTNTIHAENNLQTAKGSQRHSFGNKPQANDETHQRSTRQGYTPRQNGAPVIQKQPVEHPYHYRPFETAPEHIKQLIYQAYTPQVPYVNPHAFFYNINPPTMYQDLSSKNSIISKSDISNVEQPSIAYRTPYKPSPPAQTIARVSKTPKQAGIKYKNNVNPPRYNSQQHNNYYSQQEQTKRSPEFNSPIEKYSNGNNNQGHQNAGYQMPDAIKQLLQYQAQIPYNVLANNILFQPQKPFIPKPLSEEVLKHSGSYPNQVFYIKSNGEIYDNNERI